MLGVLLLAMVQVSNPGVTQATVDSMIAANASAARVDQKDVVLNSTGDATWTYDTAFPKAPAVAHIPGAIDTQNPIICNFTARTATSVSIHCWRTNVSGLLSSLFGGTAAGATVSLVARAVP